MEENEKIGAMEEGNATPEIINSPAGEGNNTTPAASSTRSCFSFASSRSLFPSFRGKNASGDHRFLVLPKRKWGPRRRAAKARLPTVVRPVHGDVNGYPIMAAFLDSDDNFMVYRRFGYLQTRLLLDKQEQLRRLETRLEKLDREQVASSKRPNLLCKAIIGGDMGQERKILMGEIEKTYLEHAHLLQTAHAMVSLNKPSSSEYTSVVNFVEGNKPLVTAERNFIWRKEDLITLRPGREYAWLDSFIEKLLKWCNCSLLDEVFRSEDTKLKSNEKNEVYYTRTRIDKAVNVIITMMILVLLILPIWPLYRLTEGTPGVHSSAICIGILLVFTLAFSAVITLFTRAKRHEILATSAAYCAVLVVFVSNVGNQHSAGFGAHG